MIQGLGFKDYGLYDCFIASLHQPVHVNLRNSIEYLGPYMDVRGTLQPLITGFRTIPLIWATVVTRVTCDFGTSKAIARILNLFKAKSLKCKYGDPTA